MPFVRKADSQGSQPPTDARKLFIGRTGELLFFVQNLLKPEEPTHNIISIWGQGGVGKSTLLARFIDEAHSADYKGYCLTAAVDELRTTPASIMEKFATQLHMRGAFEKGLKHYKEILHAMQTDVEMLQDTLVQRIPIFAGAAVEGVPFVGPLLGEGVKATAQHLLDRRDNDQKHKDVELLEDPIKILTRAFVDELNRLTNIQVSLSSGRVKNLRVILFFDTFEQLATEVAPWFLDYFLQTDIKSNVVLVIAGRDPIERSIPNETKRWLSYCDNETIYWIPLNSFTEDETRNYLIKRNITDPEREQIKRQLALDASLFSLPFNQDDLAAFAYLPEKELPSLYHWLVSQPFVHPQDGRYSYHDLAQELYSRYLYQRSNKGYYATRRALATHYQQLLEEIEGEERKEVYSSAEWLELELALAHQLLLLPDKVSHIKAIEHTLDAYLHTKKGQTGEIDRVLRELSQERANNYANASAQQTAEQLSYFIESNLKSQEFLTAANYLLENLINQPSFPMELLALVYRKRGWAYHRLEDYQQAIADFDRAIELDPKITNAYSSRGWVYLWLKDIKQAETDFTKSWRLDPSLIRDGLMTTWTAMCQNRPDPGTSERLEAIAEFDPQGYSAYVCRGTAQFLWKRFEEALAELERAIQLEPERWSAYFWKGMTCASLGSDEDAIAAIEKALELELPPILLTPLRWFEQDRPDFYQKYVLPLMARYDLV